MKKFSKILFILLINNFCFFYQDLGAVEKIKIGLLIPMTGINSDLGTSIIKAVRLAVNDIDNEIIEIIPKDTK